MTNSINTNIAAYFAQANITAASNSSASSVSRLSSGNRIVEASDDVSALAIGTSLGSLVSGLKTAQTNASQGSSLLQVADGALAQVQSILQQQQSIAQQAQSGSLTDTDRGYLNQEFQALSAQIDALATGTTFNGVNLIDGSIATGGSTNPLQSSSTSNTATVTVAGFTDASADTTVGSIYFVAATAGSPGFTAATSITQPAGKNDSNLFGALAVTGSTTLTATVNGDPVTAHNATGYTVTYTIGGHNYTGTIASAGDGTITAGTPLVLSGGTGFGSISLTSAGTIGSVNTDNHAAVVADITSNLASMIGKHGTFLNSPTITQPTGAKDAALTGNLANGGFTVSAVSNLTTLAAGTVGASGTALGYKIDYTINGVTYEGSITNDTTPGDGTVANGATVTLTATTNSSTHATIALTVGASSFGNVQTVDQSSNIQAALQAVFAGSTATSASSSATIVGQTSPSGIGSATAFNDAGQNDTTFIGDLSKGNFTVTGNTTTGYAVSYTLNGATYQGSVSAATITAGGTLLLDSGAGSIKYTLASASGNTATASAGALEAALTNNFAGATAYAVHTISTTLSKDANGNSIDGSAITAASTAGTLLDGFNGGKVTIQSELFDGATLPPISGFTGTGSGSTTAFSVQVDGVTYSTPTGATVTSPTTLLGANFGNGAGQLRLYKNGDNTSNEFINLDMTGLQANALITTTGDVQNVVDALNTTFGTGGAAGGLSFQLGTTASSSVAVTIGSAKTTALFSGNTLDVSTANTAATAATQVANALNTVTALRSGVGALESRFNFASAALQSSVQNEGAAQSQLLDTDIAAESTNFATQQVKLQAGISVLAQANQQLQALLKLIA